MAETTKVPGDPHYTRFLRENRQNIDEIAEYYAVWNESGGVEEMWINDKAIKLIQGFHDHNHKEPLFDAVRNQPDLFESSIFRDFVADLLTGKYKPKKEGVVAKETLERIRGINATVEYYKNMGFRTYYVGKRPEDMCAVLLAADRLGIDEEAIRGSIKTKTKDRIKHFGPFSWIESNLYSGDGSAILALNGFRTPQSSEEIEEIEGIFKNASIHEQIEIRKFCCGRALKNCPLPTNKSELQELEEYLSTQIGYDVVMRYRRLPLSIK